MKKSFILILLVIGSVFQAKTQTNDAGQQFIKKKCRPNRVSLPLSPNRPPFPPEFDSIAVLDFRRDTSRIGLINGGGRSQLELLFHAPVARQVSAYLNAGYTSPKGAHTLLVVLKDLWISDPAVLNYRMFGKPFWKVSFRFEAYLQTREGYTPITYLDTVTTVNGSSSANMAAQELPELIARFMDKVATRDLDVDVVVKRNVSYEQIDSFSRTRFNYPMDTATKLVKGVYVNVDEFRSNRPSITQYELSKDRSANLELSIPDGTGRFIYTHTAWGFCDGNQTYVMMDGNLFPIFSVHHQFYVLGSKEYDDHKFWVPLFVLIPGGSFISSTADVSESVIRSLRLFRLDVKSGAVVE
jgi:hypothetical protein